MVTSKRKDGLVRFSNHTLLVMRMRDFVGFQGVLSSVNITSLQYLYLFYLVVHLMHSLIFFLKENLESDSK